MKHAVRGVIRQKHIDSKYDDEPISFGQAVVTHHFLRAMGENQTPNTKPRRAEPEDPKYRGNFKATVPGQFGAWGGYPADYFKKSTLEARAQSTTPQDMVAVPPGPGIVQFELAEQNIMAEEQLEKGRLVNYEALKKDDSMLRKDRVGDLLSQYGDGKLFDGREEPMKAGRFIQKDQYFQHMQRFNTKKKTFDTVTGIMMEHSPQKFKSTYKDDMRQFASSPAKEQVDVDVDDYIEPGEHQFNPEARQMMPDDSRQLLSGEGRNADLQAISSAENAGAAKGSSKHPSAYGEAGRTRGGVQFQHEDTPDGDNKRRRRPMTAEEKAVRRKRAEINATTRWLPDSAFTTYFGKPPFHAYGKGNTNPSNFSQKLMTHNINAATGTYTQHGDAIDAERTKAEYAQVYDSALLAALEKNKGTRVP